jgi:hypothetical protein
MTNTTEQERSEIIELAEVAGISVMDTRKFPQLIKFAQLIRERLAGEQGEAVGWFIEGLKSSWGEPSTTWHYSQNKYDLEYAKTKGYKIEYRYAKPPQPQSVKDALEKAAKLLDEVGCKLQQNTDSLEFIQGVGAAVSAGETAIRALITDTQEKG